MPVSFKGWVKESLDHLRSEGLRTTALLRAGYFMYVGAFLTMSRAKPVGECVFERDWDALIILDSCRVDAVKQVQDEYSFLADLESIRSRGSNSAEWMCFTFTEEYRDIIQDTAYITCNSYTQRILREGVGLPPTHYVPFGPGDYDVVDSSAFRYLDEIWKYEAGGDAPGMKPPRVTTERAIHAGRTVDADRIIVHYMYPHTPYPRAPEGLQNPFPKFERGELNRADIWDLYLDNLRYVLDDVRILLENLDAETTVIASDHGEAFGEWGFYKHLVGCPHPAVRRVPWITTSASDKRTHTDFEYDTRKSDNIDVDQQLRDLGYL